MSTKSVSTILGAALLAASTVCAGAADLYRGPSSIKDGYAPYSRPLSWYLRGDFGWASHDDPVMVGNGVFDLSDTSIGNTWTAGAGIGRYLSPSVRVDFTYDHRFEADVDATLPIPGGPPFTGRGGLKSDLFLFNAYYDIDLRSRFTPYVGVGLGFVRHQTSGGTLPETIAACNCVQNVSVDNNSDWHVAGALMAGFSFAVHQRFHIDAGYRFLYLGETKTTGSFTIGGVADTASVTVEDIHAHELRVGLRLDLF